MGACITAKVRSREGDSALALRRSTIAILVYGEEISLLSRLNVSGPSLMISGPRLQRASCSKP
jgi:hypothetical protein